MGEDTELFTAIIFCPVCCSNLDSEGIGAQEFTCQQCGTMFSVTIEPAIIAEHASV